MKTSDMIKELCNKIPNGVQIKTSNELDKSEFDKGA